MVVEVDLGGGSVLEQVDHPLGLGGEVADELLGGRFPVEQGGQGGRADADGRAAEEATAGLLLLVIGKRLHGGVLNVKQNEGV